MFAAAILCPVDSAFGIETSESQVLDAHEE